MATKCVVHPYGLDKFVIEDSKYRSVFHTSKLAHLLDIYILAMCKSKDSKSANRYHVHMTYDTNHTYLNALYMYGRKFIAAKVKHKEIFIISGKLNAAKGLVCEKERSIGKMDASARGAYIDILNADRQRALVIVTYMVAPYFVNRFDIRLIDKKSLDAASVITLALDKTCNYVSATILDVPKQNCVLVALRDEIRDSYDILTINKVPLFVSGKISQVKEIQHGQTTE